MNNEICIFFGEIYNLIVITFSVFYTRKKCKCYLNVSLISLFSKFDFFIEFFAVYNALSSVNNMN